MREGLFVISRGIGQVMFQNNAFSGILMLSGILYSSWQLALLAIIGNIISTATAWICSYSREDKKWTIRIQWYFSRYRHRSIYRDNMAINVASANNFRPIHLDHLSLQPSASFIRIYGSLYFVCMDITGWMSLDISFIIIIHHTSWGRAIL